MRKSWTALGSACLVAVVTGCQTPTPDTEPDALASCRARGGEVEEVCTVRRIVFDCVTWGFSCRGAEIGHDAWCAMPAEQASSWNPREQFCNQP